MDGGNAVDAAVTVASVLSVDEPYFSGIGGHGIAMLCLADTGEVKCLDFGGFAPRAFTIDQWGSPPRHRYWDVTSSVFPGTLAGWAELLERHGTRSLAQALEPAIEHARGGVPARPVVVDFISGLKNEMSRFPELAEIYLPGGRRAPRGAGHRESRPCRYLRRDCPERGRRTSTRGPLRERIVEYYNRCGARFTEREFSEYRPRWRDTLETTYRDGYRVVVPKCQTCSALHPDAAQRLGALRPRGSGPPRIRTHPPWHRDREDRFLGPQGPLRRSGFQRSALRTPDLQGLRRRPGAAHRPDPGMPGTAPGRPSRRRQSAAAPRT